MASNRSAQVASLDCHSLEGCLVNSRWEGELIAVYGNELPCGGKGTMLTGGQCLGRASKSVRRLEDDGAPLMMVILIDVTSIGKADKGNGHPGNQQERFGVPRDMKKRGNRKKGTT